MSNFSAVFPTDQNYQQGSVLCPDERGIFSLCQHDKCPCACVYPSSVGLSNGQHLDHEGNQIEMVAPIALSGVVEVNCKMEIPARIPLVSDGFGSVRPLHPGESGYSLGFSLRPSANGKVVILLRSQFASM